MATHNLESYRALFEQLRGERDKWGSASDFAALDEAIRASLPETLVDGFGGYAELCTVLRQEGVSDDERLAETVKLAALSRPAAELGLGGHLAGYFVSENLSGQTVYAGQQYAEASEWSATVAAEPSGAHLAEDAAAVGGTRDSALMADPDTGLLYDAAGWYLKDGTTKVTQDADNLAHFRDESGNIYEMGELKLSYDPDSRLLYDASAWYLANGTTKVTQDPVNLAHFRDEDDNLYAMGELKLTHDPETRLLYDATDWYLPDAATKVVQDATDPTRFHDSAGNAYVLGMLQQRPAGDSDAASAPAPLPQAVQQMADEVTSYVEQDVLAVDQIPEDVMQALAVLSPQEIQSLLEEELDAA